MKRMRPEALDPSTTATEPRTLLVLPDRTGTSAAIDSVLIAAAGLSDGLSNHLGPVDIWTGRGMERASDLLGRAVRPASEPGRAGRMARAIPRSLRPAVGDARAALHGYAAGRRWALDGSGGFGLVIQFHHRFHRVGMHAASSLRVPLVVRLEALEVREERGWGTRRLGFGGLVERFGEMPVIHRADLIVPVSRELDGALGSLGVDPGRRLMLPNGVDVGTFSPGERDETLIDELGLGGRFIVGWIGGFRPFHGLEMAREIADGLAHRAPGAVLCLLGSGPGWESLHSGLRDHPNARVLPAVPHEDVPRWIRSFDACLLLASRGPFHYSPLKLFEYMACGRPVVTSGVGDVASFVTDGRDAVVVEACDPRAVVRAIETLAGDPNSRQRLGYSARATAEREFSWGARAAVLVQGLRDRGLLQRGRIR